MLRAEFNNNLIYLTSKFSDKERLKACGARWDAKAGQWFVAFDLRTWDTLKASFGSRLVASNALSILLARRKKEEEEFLKAKLAASDDEPVDFSVKGVLYNGANPLFNYQRHGIICGLNAGDGFLIGDQPGLGKAQPVDEIVYTPMGKTEIGNLSVGDYVIGSDGKKTRVLGVYPQGNRKVYRITFTDGNSVECDENHLWNVKYLKDEESFVTLSVAQLIKENNKEWQIPVCRPVVFENLDELTIDPYLLGAMLGAGVFEGNKVIVGLLKEDFDEMLSAFSIESLHDTGLSKAASFSFDNEQLKNLGLENCCSCGKFVPSCYKYSSIDDRLSLLQGLLDVGGNYIDSGEIEFGTASESLADDIMEIVHTLGGIATKGFRFVEHKEDRVVRTRTKIYKVGIRLPSQFAPFRLTRKASLSLHEEGITRVIKDIEYVGFKKTVCIKVDAEDELYLTRHCIVTHNTIQGIGIAMERKNRGEIDSCLVVCPASLKYNWVNEIKKFTNEKYLVIDGTKEERQQKWAAHGYFFKITNYETIVSDLHVEKNRVDRRIEICDYVLNNQEFMVLDEIQYIKNHSAQRTKIMKKFKSKYRVGLTGTPIDGRLEELHSIFQFLKPGLFSNKEMFMNRYAIVDNYRRVIRYRNEGEVKEKINPYYVRRLKCDVLTQLPPKIFKDIFVDLPERERRVYRDLIKGKAEITQEMQAATVILRARQFLDFPELIDLRNPSAKYAALKELLEELIDSNGEKVIIFTQFKQALDLLLKNLESDYNIVCIHGDVNHEERISICDRFNNDPDINIILMTNAGATGLNLASANAVINYEDDFSPATNLQRFDRAHRANTKHQVVVYRFVCVGTVEEHVRNILDEKMEVCNKILDEDISDLSVGSIRNLDLLKLL